MLYHTHSFIFNPNFNFAQQSVFTFSSGNDYVPVPPPPGGNFMITESGNNMITESGNFMITE